MAKKKAPKEPKEPPLPTFGGFQPLSGLSAFKAKLLEDEKKGIKPAPAAPPPSPKKKTESPQQIAAAESLRSMQSLEDELTFHRMMAGVRPLDAAATRVPKTAVGMPSPRLDPTVLLAKVNAEADDVRAHLADLTGEPVRFEVMDDGRFVEGRRNDVPPSVLRTLRRGLLPIDARLDLHGRTAAEAREALYTFLRDTRTRGERCVLVIHGKGTHSLGGGVLRGEISAWLSQGRAKDHVAAFATAKDADGGEGAVYIALRR